MSEPTTYADGQGHTYIVDGDTVMISVYGYVTTVPLAEAREWWIESTRIARANARPISIEAGHRLLSGR